MANKWEVKELLSAVKMNNLGVPQYSDSEQVGIVDTGRLKGMTMYNTDHETLQVYQGGNGSEFKVTEISNLLFDSSIKIGVNNQRIIYNIDVVNRIGLCNNKVVLKLKYIQQSNNAGNITLKAISNGVTRMEEIVLGSVNVPSEHDLELRVDVSGFVIDALLNIQVLGTQVTISNLEIRGL